MKEMSVNETQVQAERCRCGGGILAGTEDWPIPLCYECWAILGKCFEQERQGA